MPLTIPEPNVAFAPLFHDEHPDRMLLLKFVTWPDNDDEVFAYRMNHLGQWIEFDVNVDNEFSPEELPLIVEVEEDE